MTSLLGVSHRPPGFDLPAGACDCHTHVFGDPALYPYAAGRQYTPGLATVDHLAEHQCTLGLQRVVVVQPSPYGSDNRCTVDALRMLGAHRARGVAVIDDGTTDDELALMHTAGMRGVRVNLETHGIGDAAEARRQLLRASDRVALLGWHLQLYTRPAVLAALAPTIRDLPNDVVLDHFGGIRAESGIDQPQLDPLRDLLAGGRLWIKLSAPQRISATPDDAATAALARALVAARPDRMLWGSDWPHPGAHPGRPRDPAVVEPFHPIDDGHALARLRRWTAGDDGASDADTDTDAAGNARLRAILVDNPARLYDFAS